MVVAVCGLLFVGYPVALTLGGVSLAFAVLGHLTGVMSFSLARRAAAARLRRDDQRGAAGDPAVHVHGRDAGALAHRRGTAGDHGPAVRHAARRARHLGRDRRRAARRRQGRGRRHHRDHGPDRAAGHAAPRLRQAARRRHGRGDRDAGADLSARDRAGAARRSALDRLSGGAARAGQFRAVVGDGERSVRRRDRAGLRAGRALHSLSDLHGGVLPAHLARDSARARRAARLCAGAPADRGAGRAARCSSSRCSARSSAASRRRPKRPRSARSARCCWRRASATLAEALGAGGAQDRADHLHDLRHPDRRDAVQPGVPRARRRRHGASRARPICRAARPARSSW